MLQQENSFNDDNANVNIKVKTPKRIVHYGDGVVEEFSEDEADSCQNNSEPEPEVDPTTLAWIPWTKYKMWSMSNTTLSVVDYVGESLAYLFGITTPKYQLEINEYNRMQERLKKRDEETKGWIGLEDQVTTNQPSSKISTV